jgi:hypothetical protein
MPIVMCLQTGNLTSCAAEAGNIGTSKQGMDWSPHVHCHMPPQV